MPEGDEALLDAVVQVAPDAPALLVDDVQQPRARGVQRGLAGAEGDLMATALDLGRRARGEHQQRRLLVGARRDRPRREHADVARGAALAAGQVDAELGVEARARRRARGEDGALGQQVAAAARGEHARAGTGGIAGSSSASAT